MWTQRISPAGSGGQYVQIKYDGLEFIPLNEQMKEETA
jgi:hypothetical protein